MIAKFLTANFLTAEKHHSTQNREWLRQIQIYSRLKRLKTGTTIFNRTVSISKRTSLLNLLTKIRLTTKVLITQGPLSRHHIIQYSKGKGFLRTLIQCKVLTITSSHILFITTILLMKMIRFSTISKSLSKLIIKEDSHLSLELDLALLALVKELKARKKEREPVEVDCHSCPITR
jgi:hypothetical protein